MTLTVTHPFVSGKSDGPDPTLVQPSNWNADHALAMASGFLLGRATAGDGSVEELSGLVAAAILAISAGDWMANANAKLLSSETVWAAAAEVVITYASSLALDMSTFINAKITLTGTLALATPENQKPGQSGCIRLIQDGTGGRTVTFASDFVFAGGTAPTASTAANAQDFLYYYVADTGVINASLIKAVA